MPTNPAIRAASSELFWQRKATMGGTSPMWMALMGHLKAQMPQPLQVVLEIADVLSAVKPIIMNAYSFTQEMGSKLSLHDRHVPIECDNYPNFNIQIKHAWAAKGFSAFLMLRLDRAILALINE